MQVPPLEQGGVSQRSSRPQQVLPGARPADCNVNDEAERILSILLLPHCLHFICSSLPIPNRYSDTAPQDSHRYSYIGIAILLINFKSLKAIKTGKKK
jgi:hypothetical protein